MSESGDQIDPEDIELDDPKGRFDNWLVYLVVVAPIYIITLLVTAIVIGVLTGIIPFDVAITGDISAELIWRTLVAPAGRFVMIAAAITWVLCVMAWFGASAIIKLAKTAKQMLIDFGNSQ